MIKKGLILAAGAVLGYLYYHFIGCNSGSCPLTSTPVSSIILGIAVSAIFIIPEKEVKKEE